MIRPPPCSPLFPYTTLFRSETGVAPVDWCAQDHRAVAAALLPESHPGLSIGLRILRVTHRNRCPAGPRTGGGENPGAAEGPCRGTPDPLPFFICLDLILEGLSRQQAGGLRS